MPTVQTSGVKAADPGLGFTLNFSDPVKDTLKIVITLQDLQQSTDPYISVVTLNNKISDKDLVFVVPFGDNQYAPSNCLSFQIDVYVPNTASDPLDTLKGYVFGESGAFDYVTSVPTSILGFPVTGTMLQSADGKYIGIYRKDGNFCVYPQFVIGQGQSLSPVYTTNSDIDRPTYFYPIDSGDMSVVAICPIGESQPVSMSFIEIETPISMTIDSTGNLCLNGMPMVFNKV